MAIKLFMAQGTCDVIVMEGFGDIRSIVHGEPSALAWRQLIALIASHDTDAQRDAIVPYVNQQLDQRWPNTLRDLDTTTNDHLDTIAYWGPLVRSMTFRAKQTIDPLHLPNLTHIQVIDGYELLSAWLESAQPGIVKSLIYQKNFQPQHIAQFKTPALERLESIKLQNIASGISDDILSNLPTTLKHLNLENNQLTNHHLDLFFDIFQDNHILQSLYLGRSNFGARGVEKLCASKNLKQLRCLSLWSNDIPPQGIEALCDTDNFPRLEFLNIGGNEILPSSIEHIAKAKHLSALKQLWIWDAQVSHHALEALFNSPNLPNLSSLNLNNIRSAAIGEALGQSVNLAKMETLALCRTETNGEALKALLASDNLHGLSQLQLTGNDLSNEDLEMLSQTSSLGQLETLYLDEGSYTASGLRTLVHSPYLTNIKWVLLNNTQFVQAAVQESPQWEQACANARRHDPNSSSTLYNTHPDERLY